MGAARAERKLTAILAADVAGYSRLMGEDDETTLASLTAHRRELFDLSIAEHRGRLVKTTGDGLLAEFGSVVDAVRCAVAVQAGMAKRNSDVTNEKRLQFRIGINVGDVVEQDGDLFGDGVNIAARLEAIAEPGGIVISSTVRDHIGSGLGLDIEDIGEQTLKNITRPIRAYRLRQSNPTTTPIERPTLSLPDKPSIAVLPFQNMSGDSEQDYFADGLAEDIITRLARLRWLFVSARNSSFTYKGKVVDAKQVGRELGVRYVLDGSVRRSGQRLRIGTELSDASTGLHVWAERYDVELMDFFTLQDQICESVIASIEPRLFAAEHQRFQSRSPESLDAWGFVMKAMPYVWTWGSAKDIDTAQALLRQAIDIDPDYPRANSLLAWTHAARVQLGWVEDPEVLPTAHTMAKRAILGDPEDPWAHFAAGYVHMVSRDFDQAVAALTEAIALNPSLSFAHMILGSTYGYGGMPDDGLHHLAIAQRLSPRDFTQAGNLATIGLCHFIAGRFEDAVNYERRAVELRPHFGTAWRTLAAAAGMAGHHETAMKALSEARRLHPSISVEWVEKHHPIVHDKDRFIYIQGLRAAGLR